MSKNKRKWRNLTHLAGMCLLVTAVLSGCSVAGTNQEAAPDRKDGKVKVAATLFPYYDFAKQIGGDRVSVDLIVPAGMDTHSFEPTAKDMVTIGEADVFIYNGGTMESWVPKVLEAAEGKNITTLRMMDHVKVVDEEIVEGRKKNMSMSMQMVITTMRRRRSRMSIYGLHRLTVSSLLMRSQLLLQRQIRIIHRNT